MVVQYQSNWDAALKARPMPISVKLELSMLASWSGLFFHQSKATCAEGLPQKTFSPHADQSYPARSMRCTMVEPSEPVWPPKLLLAMSWE